MLRCSWCLSAFLAISSMLAAGCRTVVSQGAAAGERPALSSKRPPESEEAPARQLAEAHAHYAAGIIHEMNDEAEAALEQYHQAALKDPDNESLILEVSRRFLQTKQPEKALQLLARASARPKASGSIFALLGLVYSQMGKYEQAVAANRAAIKKSPNSLIGYQNLSLNYLQNRQPLEALKALDEAAKEPNTSSEFLITLAELYTQLGVQVPAQKETANARAVAVLRRAEKLNPENAMLKLRLAEGFNMAGESVAAAQLYQDLLKKLPASAPIRQRVRARLKDIYLRGSDRQKAVEQLEAIIRDDPTNPRAYYDLGSIAYEDKKLEQAAEYFSKTILLSPDFEQAYYDLAGAQMGLDKTSDALATLEKARRKFAHNFVVEFLTGMAFSRQKAYTEAIQHYTAAEVIAQATETNRLTHIFYFQLGAAYERKGDYPQAEKYFDKSLQLAPDFAATLNYLGYMWAEHGTNLQKAKELIEKALKIEPKNAAYLDSLGWVLFKLNQPKEAMDYVLKAAELSQEPDATVYDHLGDIYAALNQPDKAREAWRKSVSLEPNDQVSRKIEQPVAK